MTYGIASASSVVSLAPNALVTVEQAQAFLHVLDAARSDEIADYVNRASAFCDSYVGWILRAREYENLRLPATLRCRLRPPAVPIQLDERLIISLDGEALTVWKTEADGDPADFDVIVGFDGRDPRWSPNHLWREEAWEGIYQTPYPITLTYTGGFATVPGDLIDACLLVVENIFRQATQQTADVAAYGAGPISPGVTYRESLIPLKAARILDGYRFVAL